MLLFCPFLSHGFSGRIQTLDLKIMNQVFYHCATGALLTIFYLSWCQRQDSNPWSLDYEFNIQPLCYQRTAQYMGRFFKIFTFLDLVVGLEPVILGLWVKCSTTVLPGHSTTHRALFKALNWYWTGWEWIVCCFKVARFMRKINSIFNIKSGWSKLGNIIPRGSSVQSLPFQ